VKNIVLAAGYATRLYPLTENFPKPLLSIGEKTILDRLIEDIDGIDVIDEHIIVTNHKFIGHFEEWRQKSDYQKKITLIDDGTIDNEHRLGAVKDIRLAIETLNISNDDVLVIAADNVLDFSLQKFVQRFQEIQTSMIMCYFEPSLEALQKTGVILLDKNNRVTEMQEKPQQPKSNWAVPPFYIYAKEDLPLIATCVNEGCAVDAPGNLLSFILKKVTVHALEMPGKRTDIGTLECYEKMNYFQ
jgi:glucose-1-phosphate thymidylyltransferase